MIVAVGLGNPGKKYESSRHNLGFQVIDRLAAGYDLTSWENKFEAQLVRGQTEGQRFLLAKPQTFMNNSGEGVAYLLTRFSAQPADLVIIYDDMELPLGRLRIRVSGSDGGHKGMRSIITTLETEAFPRIRVGIGHPPPEQDPVSYVLGHFAEEDSTIITESAEAVVAAVDCLLEENIDMAMNRFNQWEQL